MVAVSHQQRGNILLQRASTGDAASIAQTAARLFSQSFAHANRPEDIALYLAEAFSEARQKQELSDERNTFWLARNENDNLIGYAHVRLGAPPPAGMMESATHAAELARLYADSAWHGRGVGTLLMRACIDTARDSGASVLWLGVWERNPRAIAFYRKHGFRPIGEQPFTLGADRQRDLVMALDLTTSEG